MGHSESDIKRLCPSAEVKRVSAQGGNVQNSEAVIMKWLEEKEYKIGDFSHDLAAVFGCGIW